MGTGAADLREDEDLVTGLEEFLQHLVHHLQLAADIHQVLVNPDQKSRSKRGKFGLRCIGTLHTVHVGT